MNNDVEQGQKASFTSVLTQLVKLTKHAVVGCINTVSLNGTPWNPNLRNGWSKSMAFLVVASTFSQKLLKALFNLCRNSRSACSAAKSSLSCMCWCLPKSVVISPTSV